MESFMRNLTRALMMTVIVCAFCCTAHAAETLDCDSNAADIAMALTREADGQLELMPGAKFDAAIAASIRRSVQEYVDAIQGNSETSAVTASIYNPGKSDQYLILYLKQTGADEFTDAELDTILNSSGRSLAQINQYVCDVLTYDRSAADNARSLVLSSDACVAKRGVDTGKGVCQSYANLFTVLAQRAGHQVIKLRGHLDNGGYHVANAVVEADGSIAIYDTCSNDSSPQYWANGIPLDDYCEKLGFAPSIDAGVAFDLKY